VATDRQRVGVLGTGMVGQTLARRLTTVGYDVMVGARSRDSDSLSAFSDGDHLATGSFEDAAAFGEMVLNATNGSHALAALGQAGADNLAGKPLIDVTNDLEPVEGGYPKPRASVDSSLGQRLQEAFPVALVVKTLNTMNCQVMANPSIVEGDHVVFMSGNDPAAKRSVAALLAAMGWRHNQIIDLGGIETAAATEMMMLAWMRVRIARGMDAPPFNWAIHSG
jgi:8-hydroxy-5-deazaflavin:NADPH oxidoreductase